jgi:hypothetical protein
MTATRARTTTLAQPGYVVGSRSCAPPRTRATPRAPVIQRPGSAATPLAPTLPPATQSAEMPQPAIPRVAMRQPAIPLAAMRKAAMLLAAMPQSTSGPAPVPRAAVASGQHPMNGACRWPRAPSPSSGSRRDGGAGAHERHVDERRDLRWSCSVAVLRVKPHLANIGSISSTMRRRQRAISDSPRMRRAVSRRTSSSGVRTTYGS